MDELTQQIQQIASRSIRNEARIEKLEDNQKALTELTLSVQELATNQGNMKEDLTEIKTDVKSLSQVPAKRWNSLIDKLIAVIAGAFLTWLFTSK